MLNRPALNERGQVVVLFALLIPVIFAIGAIVLDVGNWYVHKRHIQTQVDAAALAGGTQFTTCLTDASTNGRIRSEALKYAGDTARSASTTNLQVQQPDDVRVVLNSADYWRQGDPTDGSTHDDTIDPDSDPLTPGDPCSTKFLDAKATDDEVPPLWGLIPLTPSPKTHAKVRIEIAGEAQRVMPWAVPEVDPLAVAAIIIDEETGLVMKREFLNGPTQPPPLAPFNVWSLDIGDVDVTSQNMGVIVLVSKIPEAQVSLPAVGTQPDGACSVANVECYSADGGAPFDEGLSFIHGYDDAVGTSCDGTTGSPQTCVSTAVIHDVQLSPVGCTTTDPSNLSAAYFVRTGPCSALVQAQISFGFGTGEANDCPPANQNAAVTVNGAAMACAGGIWTGSVNLPLDQGRQVVTINWQVDPPDIPGPPRRRIGPFSATFPKVSAPYIRETDSLTPGLFSPSGPVEYLKLECFASAQVSCVSALANSMPDENASLTGPTVRVTVGLAPPLSSGQKVVMRLASGSNDSKTQALDCDGPPPGNTYPNNDSRSFEDEIRTGCFTTFSLNYDKTTTAWRDINCADYKNANAGTPTYRYPLPVDYDYNPSPRPDCVRVESGGKLGLFRKAMHDRFESPCTDNNWPTPPAEDKRWVTLVVTDATAFRGSGASPDDSIPVKILGSFYVTGWTTGGQAQGCSAGPKPNEAPPPGLSGNSGDVWGYFRTYVLPSSSGSGTGDDCVFDGNSVCVAVLVE